MSTPRWRQVPPTKKSWLLDIGCTQSHTATLLKLCQQHNWLCDHPLRRLLLPPPRPLLAAAAAGADWLPSSGAVAAARASSAMQEEGVTAGGAFLKQHSSITTTKPVLCSSHNNTVSDGSSATCAANKMQHLPCQWRACNVWPAVMLPAAGGVELPCLVESRQPGRQLSHT